MAAATISAAAQAKADRQRECSDDPAWLARPRWEEQDETGPSVAGSRKR
jgi:hypothetical protein